jgi:hypothetical protein
MTEMQIHPSSSTIVCEFALESILKRYPTHRAVFP